MLHFESEMMSSGYDPARYEGSLKCPIFATSTFQFPSAEEAKREFELAYGLIDGASKKAHGYIYSRLGNPNVTLLEKRLTILEESQAAVAFNSGMAAISTLFQTFLRPGDVVLHSTPLYGGTYNYLHEILSNWGVSAIGFRPEDTAEDIIAMVESQYPEIKPAIVFLETPANPTNDLFSIREAKHVSDYFAEEGNKPIVVVDNTYMGPIWQKPLEFGADIVLYSATKFLGGHSDLIAGAIMTNFNYAEMLRMQRTFSGTTPDPMTCWLITRSLETLKLRMNQQCENATIAAEWLGNHPLVEDVLYPSMMRPIRDSLQYSIYKKQCLKPGAILAFKIKGGEKEAFAFLNDLKLIKLAVSLGSTESLAEHPYTMTHLDLFDDREKYGITPNLVRISFGVENIEDLITDLSEAFESFEVPKQTEFANLV